MRGPSAVVATAIFAVASVVALTLAGADKVVFPAYQTHVLYDVLDQTLSLPKKLVQNVIWTGS